MTPVTIYYPSFIIGTVWSSGVYPSTFPSNHSSTYIKKIFRPSYWFSCLQLSFLCTQKSVTKRSSYSEFVKMCLKKQRRRKKMELKPRLNLSEPKELQ